MNNAYLSPPSAATRQLALPATLGALAEWIEGDLPDVQQAVQAALAAAGAAAPVPAGLREWIESQPGMVNFLHYYRAGLAAGEQGQWELAARRLAEAQAYHHAGFALPVEAVQAALRRARRPQMMQAAIEAGNAHYLAHRWQEAEATFAEAKAYSFPGCGWAAQDFTQVIERCRRGRRFEAVMAAVAIAAERHAWEKAAIALETALALYHPDFGPTEEALRKQLRRYRRKLRPGWGGLSVLLDPPAKGVKRVGLTLLSLLVLGTSVYLLHEARPQPGPQRMVAPEAAPASRPEMATYWTPPAEERPRAAKRMDAPVGLSADQARGQPLVAAPESSPRDLAETMPAFPGGAAAMYRFLSRHLRYPEMAIDREVQGTVYVRFVVEASGSLRDFEVLRRIGYGCDEEALRIVRLMPRWQPGRHQGEAVAVYYTLPVRFVMP